MEAYKNSWFTFNIFAMAETSDFKLRTQQCFANYVPHNITRTTKLVTAWFLTRGSLLNFHYFVIIFTNYPPVTFFSRKSYTLLSRVFWALAQLSCYTGYSRTLLIFDRPTPICNWAKDITLMYGIYVIIYFNAVWSKENDLPQQVVMLRLTLKSCVRSKRQCWSGRYVLFDSSLVLIVFTKQIISPSCMHYT